MGQTMQNDPQRGSSMAEQRQHPKAKKGTKPGVQDFEEIFGKDIDQFLEDSEWDVKDGNNQVSGTNKMKRLEKEYQKAAK